MEKTYLGDGLYVSHDGYQFELFAMRGTVWHWVALEPEVVDAFHRFIERKLNVKITVTPIATETGEHDAAEN